MKKVLFVTYGGGHVNIVKELYKKMNIQHKFDIQILALTIAAKTLQQEQIPCKQISDYMFLFEKEKSEIKNFGELLAKEEFNPESGIEYEDNKAYLGLNFWDLINEYGGFIEAMSVYKKKGRQFFNPIKTVERILQYELPDIVVVTCGVRMEKAAAISAKKLNIPVLRICDLPEGDGFFCDSYVAVMNQYGKEYIKNHTKIKEENIYVTGQPIFEANQILDLVKKKDLEEYLKRKNYDHIILLLLQSGMEMDELILKYKNIAEKHQQDLFLIKLHPGQSESTLPIKTNKNIQIIGDIEVKYPICISDVVITYNSTAGLEAALMDKELIVVNTTKIPYITDFSEYGIAVKVNDLDKLEDMIYKICLKDNPVIGKIRQTRRTYDMPKNATENIVDLISKICDKKV